MALGGESEAVAAAEIAALLRSVRKAVVSVTEDSPSATYLAATVKDPLVFANLSGKLSSVGYTAGAYKDAKTLINLDKTVFLAQAGEMLYAANTEENLHKLVDDAFAATPLSDNTDYRSVTSRTGTNFITAYFRPEFFNSVAKSSIPQEGMTDEEKAKLEQILGGLRGISAMAFGVGAEEQGLRVMGLTLGNKAVLDEMQLTFNMIPEHASYLVSSLPTGNTIFVTESYNIRQALANSIKLNGMDQAQLDEVAQQLRTSLQAVGLDLNDDVYALFEKGTALALQTDTGNLFPRLTLVTDVSGKEANAEKVLSALNKGLSDLIAQLTSPESGIPAGLISQETAKVGEKDFTKVSVNTATISAFLGDDTSPNLKAVLEGLKVELWLGVTDENQLFVTTSSDFAGRYKKESIADETDYKDALSRLSNRGSGVAYLHFANLVSYIDQVYTVVTEAQGGVVSADDSYKKFVDSLKPLRYLVLGSSAKEYETETNGFVKGLD